MNPLQQLRQKLDLLANLNHGRLPEVRRHKGWDQSARVWREFPDIYDLLAHGGVTIDQFRVERDEAVRRWNERWARHRLSWDGGLEAYYSGKSHKRVTKATFLRPEMRRLYDDGHGIVEVARQLGLNRQTVRNEISRYEAERVHDGHPCRPIKN